MNAFLPFGALHRGKNKGVGAIKAKLGIEVTKKGIPVVSEECDDDGCSFTQVAEIEREEVILDKELIDELMKHKDNPKKAGRLLYKSLNNVEGNAKSHSIKNRK